MNRRLTRRTICSEAANRVLEYTPRVASVWAMSMLMVLMVYVAGPSTSLALGTMEVLHANEYLELFVDPSTTELAVRDKQTGEVWYSNPPGTRSDPARALLSLQYYGPGAATGTMNTFTDSVEHNQFQILPLEDGIRIDFVIGREYERNALIPQWISPQRVEEVLNRAADQRSRSSFLSTFNRNYSLIQLKPVEEGGAELWSGFPAFEGYTITSPDKALQDREVQALMRLLHQRMRDSRRDLERIDQITLADFAHLLEQPTYILNDRIPAFLVQGIEDAFRDIGYAMDDKAADNVAHNVDPPRARLEVFQIPMEFRLDGPDFVVTIPTKEIVYPIDVVDYEAKYGRRDGLVTLPIHSVRVLEFFGAADQDAQGYIFVPDGSGGLIHLNKRVSGSSHYVGNVYGGDLALASFRERITVTQQVHLPVFGLHENGRSFVAVLEGGEATAAVRASLPTSPGMYNTVFSSFVVLPRSVASLAKDHWQPGGFGAFSTVIGLYQSRTLQEDIQIRYSFLHGAAADYSGMARWYQEYLVDRGVLTERVPEGARPLFLELIGAIERRANILGFPRTVVHPLTTYKQAQNILEELAALYVDRVVVRYNGWFNGGVHHTIPSRIRLVNVLGTRADFSQLTQFVHRQQWELFPEVSLLSVETDNWFDGFNSRRDAARTLDRRLVTVPEFCRATLVPLDDRDRYALSPLRLDDLVSQFTAQYDKYDIPAVSLRYAGTELFSDFRERVDLLVDRQQAKGLVENALQRLSVEAGLSLMVGGGNLYTLPYVRYIAPLPHSGSGFDIIDTSIPFVQMVLHGYKEYAGEPINLARNPRDQVLKTIEYGANPYFTLGFAPSSDVKDTRYDHLFSLHYRDWIDEAVALYAQINGDLGHLRAKTMVQHDQLAEGVYRMEYENGDAVFVNYNQHPVVVGDIQIEEQGYRIIRKEVARR